MAKDVLTFKALAAVTGVPKSALRRWSKAGLLSCPRHRGTSRGRAFIFGPEVVKAAKALRNRKDFALPRNGKLTKGKPAGLDGTLRAKDQISAKYKTPVSPSKT